MFYFFQICNYYIVLYINNQILITPFKLDIFFSLTSIILNIDGF